ncbi:MAG: glycosyltransferase [Bdellovibrionales bacterium]|nr:glycosyltransferase [Bdellovibrionales bacterium]
MSNFFVSIVLPTYNRKSTLARAIKSILQQTHSSWELLIIDDGSTDNSMELLDSIEDSRVHWLTLPSNKGVSTARNKGIEQSKYDWIALIDSDDEWLPNKLEEQINFIERHPSYQFVHCDEIWIRRGQRVNPHKKHAKHGGRIYEHCLPLCCVSPSASLIHKKLFLEEGFFKEDYPVCEDYDLWLRFFSKYEAGYLNKLLLKKYGGHSDQLSNKYFAMDYWRVKALHENLELNKEFLTLSEYNLTVIEILKKTKILLKGFEKHQNFSNYKEIKYLYNFYLQLTVAT